ncbi:hypothetical protein OPT61_g7976 [Boeremia exigua]|uniref:Uncharacterized protein n=1 Tax=Boeremia exigua TaxID=749465 RepID=A0ACC2I162_9PLEO|nr:hypothetical protein OPT61_g7976 [Boeremia exigua]
MASRESRTCPHFDTHDGVCGCPEFWQATVHLQDDRASSLQETSTALHAPNGQLKSRVDSIPLPDRTKSQAITPAPPGPPKETCFFWYHGTCRRGIGCDRPHEAHHTWPIPPPPGFRHFEPCTLPLCPLRTDLDVSATSQKQQRRGRTMTGQVDGAAFSCGRTADEILTENIDNGDIGMHGGGTNAYSMVSAGNAGKSADSAGTHGATGNRTEKRADAFGEVSLRQELPKFDLKEPDYVDFSRLLTPASLVEEETFVSISHPGTISKRRRLPAISSSESKRVKLEEYSSMDLANAVSILERPRVESQWDVKPSIVTSYGQHTEAGAPLFATMHTLPSTAPESKIQTSSNPAECVSQPFDPPRGPRSMNKLPLICFFYYHKGYCKPKRKRRCDYLHDLKTSQQTVSLPHGIDNHDPQCALPLCPIYLHKLDQTREDPSMLAPSTQLEIKHELAAPPKITGLPTLHTHGSLCSGDMAVQGSPSRGTLSERYGERDHLLDDTHTRGDAHLSTPIFNLESGYEENGSTSAEKRRKKKGKRRAQRQANAVERMRLRTMPQGLCDQSVAFRTRKSLPSLPAVKEETVTPATLVDSPARKRREDRNKRAQLDRSAENVWSGDAFGSESLHASTSEPVQAQDSVWPFQHAPSSARPLDHFSAREEQQVGGGRVYAMAEPTNPGPLEWSQLLADAQLRSAVQFVPYEYVQQSLGLTAEERQEKRRAETHAEQTAKREAYDRALLTQDKQDYVTSDITARPATVAVAPSLQLGTGTEDMRRPRCRGCHDRREGGDPQRPCLSCGDAGVKASSCVDWVKNTTEEHDKGSPSTTEARAYQLSEIFQRFELNADTMRRLFGGLE